MKHIFILNGPPGSGKDTIADTLAEVFGFRRAAFKDSLYKKTAAHYNIDLSTFVQLAANRVTKEQPSELLNGMSPRQALIYVSESVIKPAFGKQYFGEALAEACDANENYIISDGGFAQELEPLLTKWHVSIIQLVPTLNAGMDVWKGDSRRYIDFNVLGEVRTLGNHSVAGSCTEVMKLISQRMLHVHTTFK